MLTQLKILSVRTPRHWQALCYICNLALSVSFTKMFITFHGGGGKIKKKQIALQGVELERVSQQTEDLWHVRNFSFLPSRVFFSIYLFKCNPFPFYHYVIYNLNL